MTNRDCPGLWRRLVRALKRAVLGRSTHEYVKQFTGDDDRPPRSVPAVGRASKIEYEPVHGWTIRQLDEYLARNPAYQPTYEAKAKKCRQAGWTSEP